MATKKTFWWMKVRDPDKVVREAAQPVSDRKIRYSTLMRRGGMFRNNPSVARALVEGDVPMALASRAFETLATRQATQVANQMKMAGYTDSSLEPNVARPRPQQQQPQGLASPQAAAAGTPQPPKPEDESNGFWGWVGDAASGVGNFLKESGEGILEGMSWAYNRTINAPMSAGYASDDDFDRWVDSTTQEAAGKWGGGLVTAPLSIAGGIKNWFEGTYRNITGDISDQQAADIKRAGLNPDSAGDRVAFYSQDFGEAMAPVSDADVEWLKNSGRYSVADVDAAREIVTRGALDDLTRSFPALSKSAQDFILRATEDKNLMGMLEGMADSSQTTFGGRLTRNQMPDAMPGDWYGPGSTSRMITSTIADVTATWHFDPTVIAAKGVQAARAARFGINIQSADRIERTAQMLKASDEGGKAQGYVARRFEQAMDVADQIVTLQNKGDEGLMLAAKKRDRWLTQFPGYDSTLDLLVGMRNGSVGKVSIRSGDEAAEDAAQAANRGRTAKPWRIEAPGDNAPFFRFTNDDGTQVDQLTRATQRAKVADELATFIFAEAAAGGRPYVGSNVMLPGQMSVNGAIRAKLAPVFEAIGRRDRSYMKQMKAIGVDPIKLSDGVSADAMGRFEKMIGPGSTQWVRENYSYGITHAASRAWRNFERTFSNKTIVPTSPDSVKVYGQLVGQIFPKRQAQIASTIYAGANPAERMVMVKQTLGSMLNVMRLRNTPESQRLVENLTKGLVPTDELLENGYKVGERQWYTTPDGNFIRVGQLKMPGAVHSWQLNDAIELPNLRELRGLVDRGKLMNMITGTTNSEAANALITAWKSSKVSTWSNMFRQALELGTFTAVWSPKSLGEYRKARKAVKADVMTRRVNDRDLERLANKVNHLDAEDLDKLETVRRRDPETYVATLSSMFSKNGINPAMTEVLSRLAVHAPINEWVQQVGSSKGARVTQLAMLGPWDAVKRVRAERARRKGGTLTQSPVSQYLDEQLAEDMLQAAAKQLGTAAESYAFNTAERGYLQVRQRITDAAGQGISYRPVKITNGYQWTEDSLSADVWAAELSRRMNDPASSVVMRSIAKRYLQRRKGGTKEVETWVDDPAATRSKPWRRDDDSSGWEDSGSTPQVKSMQQVALTEDELDDLADNLLSGRLRGEQIDKEARSALKMLADAREIERLTKLQATSKKGSKSYLKRQKQLDDLGPAPTPKQLQDATAELGAAIAKADADPLFNQQMLSDPDRLMQHVFAEHPLGQQMREKGMRLQFLENGRPVTNDIERRAAAASAAKVAVDDLIHHMGGKPTRYVNTQGQSRIDPSFGSHIDDDELLGHLDDVMEDISKGFAPGPDDLRPLLNGGMGPDGLVTPIHAPMMPGNEGFFNRLANYSTRFYGAVVAGPLERLGSLPLFVANKRLAMGDLEPVVEELTRKGIPVGHAAYLVDNIASQRALNTVFRGTDNPMEKTVFAEMADKWLPFTRANIDFLRRLTTTAVAQPVALARTNILMQAATGAGIVHVEPIPDEEGNSEYRMTFTYPGTAAAQRVLGDALVSLGLAPEEMLRVPQFDGLKSQVRFLNPGIANPFGFSANPIFGMGIEVAGAIWPAHEVEFERIKKALSGSTDYEGKNSTFSWQNFVPSMFSRLTPLMDQDNAESQFQSAMRAALMYAEVAGMGLDSNASPEDRAKFTDAIRATTTNILIQRAVLGSFLPAAPQIADPDFEVDGIARLQGLTSLRSEFFDIRKEMSAKYPDDFVTADAEAVAEFARRYPGELIVNPGAFSVGSTDIQGSDQFVPYTLEATRWVFENKEFVDSNPLIALALLPQAAEEGAFNNEAYKLQFKSDLRTNKEFDKFLTDVTVDSDLNEFFTVMKEYSIEAKRNPQMAKTLYAQRDNWEANWRKVHPLAAAELERRSDPQFVHGTVIPAVQAVVEGRDALPENLRAYLPAVEEMYNDYRQYRQAYESVDYYDNSGRSKANTAYRDRGDMKWIGTPLERMWDLMAVTEGY